MARDDKVTLVLTLAEAAALDRIGDIGLRAAGCFNLIQNTSTAERAWNKLRAAISEAKPKR